MREIISKKISRNALKTASERAIGKTAEGTGDLITNKIANKITKISRTSSEVLTNWTENIGLYRKIPKKYI